MSDLGPSPSPSSTNAAVPVPSLCQWAGGEEALERLFARFYEHVHCHPLLAPLFATADPRHSARVATFVGEVLGGRKAYSEAGGTHAGMIAHHCGRHLSEEQRRTWVALLLDTADEVGLPGDPEFRASFIGYLEWGSRLAVLNSQMDETVTDANVPMPSWTWSSPGGPYQG